MSGPAQAYYNHLALVETATEESLAATEEVRLNRWQSALIALGSLILVYGVAFGVTAIGGVALHAFEPARHVDVFASLHNMWVVGVLLGITVLWLLPPHPWAKRVISPESREQPVWTAGGAEGGGDHVDAAQFEVPGPEAASRPLGDRRSDIPSLGGS